MLRAAFRVLSPGGASGRLSTLIFHRVTAEQDPLFPGEMHARRFEALLGWLRDWFNVLPMDQAIDQWREGRLPPRAAVITFDDGYADNQEVALPLLERMGLSATCFVATGFLDGGRMWNDTLIEAVRHCRQTSVSVAGLSAAYADLPALDLSNWEARRRAAMLLISRAKYLPMEERRELVEAVARTCEVRPSDRLMMSSAQLRDWHRRGMGVGGHTIHHPILARTELSVAQREITGGKAALEALLDVPVRLFAYPNGKPQEDYLPEHVDMVRAAGFDAAVTTSPGAARRDTQPHEIPRFTPWDEQKLRFGLRLARNLL